MSLERIFAIALFAVLGVSIAGLGYLAMVTPSCEDRGMTTELLYLMPITQVVGNVPITNLVPIYGCR